MTNHHPKEVISGKNIVYFGPGQWNGLWRNRHQLMVRFARSNKVMYVEPSFNLRSVVQKYNPFTNSWLGFIKALTKPKIREPYPNLYVYSPPVYAFIVSRFRLHKAMWWLWRKILQGEMRKLSFANPVIWFSHPSMVHLVDKFDAAVTIYHVVDAYTAYSRVDSETKRKLLKADDEMTRKVDLVFVVSKKLSERRIKINLNTHIIPNGVDFKRFDDIEKSDNPPPSDLEKLPKPIIGYSGLIGVYIDLEIFKRISETYPELSIVIVGEKGNGPHVRVFDKLIQKKNIHYLGNKKIEELPHYLKAFDVCLVPYCETEQVIYSSSLKMYDYLAFGKPIVSTSFPTSRQLKEYVYLSRTKVEFVDNIARALSENGQKKIELRKRYASFNTWEHRVATASTLIEKALGSAQK